MKNKHLKCLANGHKYAQNAKVQLSLHDEDVNYRETWVNREHYMKHYKY